MTDLDVLDRAIKQEVAGEAVLRPLRLGILLDPADDLARLAYADALEELGRTVEASRIRARLASPGVCEEAEACGVRTVESRGFVRSASCTLETFLREAGRLFAYYPITEVTLTDRRPLRSEGSFIFLWSGSNRTWVNVAAEWLPLSLCEGWANLPQWLPLNSFPSRQAANHALSANCVNYGRSLAGLPPLEVRAHV